MAIYSGKFAILDGFKDKSSKLHNKMKMSRSGLYSKRLMEIFNSCGLCGTHFEILKL